MYRNWICSMCWLAFTCVIALFTEPLTGDTGAVEEDEGELINSEALAQDTLSKENTNLYEDGTSVKGSENVHFGVEGQTVFVFAPLNSKATLVCTSRNVMWTREVIGLYVWVFNPEIYGKLQEYKRLIMYNGFKLDMYRISAIDSGDYICSYSYRYNHHIKNETIKFSLSVYHNPGQSIQFLSSFRISDCENNAVVNFTKELLKEIEYLVHDLQYEIHLRTTTCNPPVRAVTLQFDVLPFGLGFCYTPVCQTFNRTLKEAFHRIEHFFPFPKTLHYVSSLNYLSGSFSAVIVEHCNPGYGKIRKNCQECCIACPPGRFSANLGTLCHPCAAGSYNPDYGQVACVTCPDNKCSNRQGSIHVNECYKPVPLWVVLLILTCLLFGIFMFLIYGFYKVRTVYQNIMEEEVKSSSKQLLKTKPIKLNDHIILNQLNKLKSPLKYKKPRKHKAKFTKGNKDDSTSSEEMSS